MLTAVYLSYLLLTPHQNLPTITKNNMAFRSPSPSFNWESFPMTESELRFDLNRAIIAVHFYAKSERGIDPSQRLTYSHVAAIYRQEFSTLPEDTLADIDGDTIESIALNITRKIDDINQAKAEIAADITQMEHDLNSLIYNKLLSKYPLLRKEDLEVDLDNLEFFDSLDRSPAYEKTFLQVVRSKYAKVPHEMKEGLGLDNMGI